MMLLDYNSLLIAIGFSSACLCITMFGSWLSTPKERFLLTWSIGVFLVAASVVFYDSYVQTPGVLSGVGAFATMLAGLAVVFGAGHQFRTRRSPGRYVLNAGAAAFAVVLTPMALGYDGISLVALNLAALALLVLTAREYWLCRMEAPVPIAGLVGLYAATGISFGICAAMLLSDFRVTIGVAPHNWAEELNVIVSIISVTGIGALSLALNQWRIGHGHRMDSVTDQLTGLLNRRALFDRYGGRQLNAFTAVVLFDLDHFKEVNDRHGHAIGDEVLKVFSAVLRQGLAPTDSAARLGGEEFVLVLPRSEAERVERIAQQVRTSFAATPITTPEGDTFCTVSAGVAFGTVEGLAFEKVLSQADAALYGAKRDGRNRVARTHLKLVG